MDFPSRVNPSSIYYFFITPLLLFLQCSVSSFLILQTSRNSPLRWLGFSTVTGLGVVAFMVNNAVDIQFKNLYTAAFAFYGLFNIAHLGNLILILQVNKEDLQKMAIKPNFLSVLSLAVNYRGIGTPFLAKGTPHFPAYFQSKQITRPQFLARQSLFIVWQLLVLDLVQSSAMKPSPEDEAKTFGPGSEFKFFDATRDEVVGRVMISLVTWFFVGRDLIDVVYRITSLLSVGLGLTDPGEWPPFFGRMAQAYTIRGYWGSFWHQMLRWPLTGVATFITKDILCLPKPGIVERYTNILLVFTLSGLLHTLHGIALGKSYEESLPTMINFQSFAVGIMIEDGIQALWRSLTRKSQEVSTLKDSNEDADIKKSSAKKVETDSEEKTPTWQKAVGYAWTVGFFCVVAPFYQYSTNRLPPHTQQLWDFNLTNAVGIQSVLSGVIVGAVLLLTVFRAEL